MFGIKMPLLRKIFIIPACLFWFFIFSSTLPAGEKKNLAPLPTDIQKELDQSEPKAAFSNPSLDSPAPLPMEEEELINPLIPSELFNAEDLDTKG